MCYEKISAFVGAITITPDAFKKKLVDMQWHFSEVRFST